VKAAVVAGVAVCVVGAAVCVGPDGVAVPDALLALRVSRVALGVVVGAALAVVGAALQALLRNPLADPYVLGVSGGAALGASLWTWALSTWAAASTSTTLLALGLPGAASVGAFAASMALAAFAVRGGGADGAGRGERTLLVGVVLNAFSWAVVALVRALVPASALSSLSTYLIGSVPYPAPGVLAVAVVVVGAALAVVFRFRGHLYALRAGDDEAARLGVDVDFVRVVVVVAASVLVGVAVGTSGVIGFWGLLVPHLVRRLVSSDERVLLPLCAVVGGAGLAACDAAARLAFVVLGSELPVGAATALAGAPALAWLLWRRVG
jgi:iron complex transport system permease protein